MNQRLKNYIKEIVPSSIFIRKLNRNAKHSLLLTFDDGPHETLTPQVLSLLDQYRAKAIFFVVGKFADRNPELLLDIHDRGHVIGNHTYNHRDCKISSYGDCYSELNHAQEAIQKITGRAPSYFRPPMGVVSFKALFCARRLSMRTVLWSSAGEEWATLANENSETIAEQFLRKVKDRDIALFHDNHPEIVDILRRVLPVLAEDGYDLSTAARKFS